MKLASALSPAVLAFAFFMKGSPAVADDSMERFFETRLRSDPEDFVAANQLVDRLLARFRREGSLNAVRRADEVSVQSLAAVPAELNPGGVGARARVLFSLHRFPEARELARQWIAQQPEKSAAHLLLGDVLLEFGDFDGAQTAWGTVSEDLAESAAVLGRLARMAWIQGEQEKARALLDETLAAARVENDVETLAWALVRRGYHAFRTGDWDTAARLYDEAMQVAPDDWTVLEHWAELRAAQGREEDALTVFTRLAESTGRPEMWQAIGDFHAFQKRPREAEAAHQKALEGYMDSVERGEVLYLHHLSGFFADSLGDHEASVKWAREDLKVRDTPHVQAALAWALYRGGNLAEAKEMMAKALPKGVADPHVLYQAGLIFLSGGDPARGNALLRQCAAINPYFGAFHLHR
jgi:tetratricopeptide (TPR) repeat protein